MKKILYALFLSLSFLFVSCGEKDVPAEITIIGENQEEQVYQIRTTYNAEEVKEALKLLNDVIPDASFSGVSMKMNAKAEGNITVKDKEVRTIDLGYDVKMNAETNLKKYQIKGMLEVDGYTKTDSNSLTLNSKQTLKADFQNDDAYLYFDITANLDVLRGTMKLKQNILEFTDSYKAMIVSFIDLYKYYKISAIIPNIDQFVEDYKLAIVKTTKDTFTLSVHLPSSLIAEDLDFSEDLVLNVEISCKRVLPTSITFEADELIKALLEEEYVEKYLAAEVDVKTAKLSFSIELEYGDYTIPTISEEEKALYTEYSF